ncbi:hypothetical protein QR680_008829 [Steinernema hermaphroditum]|uniref:Uncharacterized protein n=1 Tax=Steinernema hermaphroditum TaxID=289476 RepID=A0AA39IK94_9BILA|nr:hypothetical protein QR680_008829 [Steinernema hermaphroditum]
MAMNSSRITEARSAFFSEHIAVLSDPTKQDLWSAAFLEIRKQLCASHNTKLLVRGVRFSKNFLDALQCAWSLTNLSCGQSAQTKEIIEKGGIEVLVRTLKCTVYVELRDQSMWALANVACESHETVERIRKMNLAPKLIHIIMDKTTTLRTLKNAVWFASRLLYRPSRETKLKRDHARVLTALMMNLVVDDFEGKDQRDVADLKKSALNVLFELIDQEQQCVPEIILNDTAFIPYILEDCKESPTLEIEDGYLRVLGSISCVSDPYTLRLIELGLIDSLFHMLEKAPNPQSRTLNNLYWVISNVAGCERDISEHLFTHEQTPIFYDRILRAIDSKQSNVARDVCFVILNSFASGSDERFVSLLHRGFFKGIDNVVKNHSHEGLWDVLVDVMVAGSTLNAFMDYALAYDFDETLDIVRQRLQTANSNFASFAAEFSVFFERKRESKDDEVRERFGKEPGKLLWRRTESERPDAFQIGVEIAFDQYNETHLLSLDRFRQTHPGNWILQTGAWTDGLSEKHLRTAFERVEGLRTVGRRANEAMDSQKKAREERRFRRARSSTSTMPTLNDSWSSAHFRRLRDEPSSKSSDAILKQLQQLEPESSEWNEDPTDSTDWPLATIIRSRNSKYNLKTISPKKGTSKTTKSRSCESLSGSSALSVRSLSRELGVDILVSPTDRVAENRIVDHLDRTQALLLPAWEPEMCVDGPRKLSSKKELKRFYCSNAAEAEMAISVMATDDFRLFPVDSTVGFSELDLPKQDASFVIYHKKNGQNFSCYRIVEAFVGQRNFFYVECIDDGAPKFETPRELLNFYVNTRPYYSFTEGAFVRFPHGKVMKKFVFCFHFARD